MTSWGYKANFTQAEGILQISIKANKESVNRKTKGQIEKRKP